MKDDSIAGEREALANAQSNPLRGARHERDGGRSSRIHHGRRARRANQTGCRAGQGDPARTWRRLTARAANGGFRARQPLEKAWKTASSAVSRVAQVLNFACLSPAPPLSFILSSKLRRRRGFCRDKPPMQSTNESRRAGPRARRSFESQRIASAYLPLRAGRAARLGAQGTPRAVQTIPSGQKP